MQQPVAAFRISSPKENRVGTFADKIAVVTGGASGIGEALAQSLAERGAVTVIADLNSEGARRVADNIKQCGGRAEAVTLDVSDAEEVQRLVDETVAKHGRLDFIFNNAGIGVGGEVQNLKLEDWRRIIDINLMGVIYGTSAAYQVMIQQGFGHIVNTASLAGLISGPGMVPYVAAKHAVVGLSKSLRVEAEIYGVKVTAVCPGFIQTGIYDAGTYRNFSKEQLLKQIPFKMVSSRDAARIILRGIEKNKAIIAFPFYARLFWWLHRISPKLTAPLERKTIKDFRASSNQ